jgi:hypothetical protein
MAQRDDASGSTGLGALRTTGALRIFSPAPHRSGR